MTLAVTDPLTSIYNRRYMSDFLTRKVERSRRTGRPFAVIMSDVDDFKKTNDSYGHLFGDKVLREVAAILEQETREYDTVGRFGGEKFLIIMPETGKDFAATFVDRLRQTIQKHVFEPVKGDFVSITVSFGVSAHDEDGASAEDLLVRADERLYRAKKLGKNAVVSS